MKFSIPWRALLHVRSGDSSAEPMLDTPEHHNSQSSNGASSAGITVVDPPQDIESDAADSNSEPKAKHSSSIRTQFWWKLELFAAALSVAGMLTLLALFFYFDGKEQQKWHILTHFTLNAVVALVTTVTKTALGAVVGSTLCQNMWNFYASKVSDHERSGRPIELLPVFEDASRGLLGSLRLIWVLRGKQLACIGALLTILSLGFDTFAQQVLAIEYRNIPAKDSSELIGDFPQSVNFAAYIDRTLYGDQADFRTKASVYAGILGGSVPEISVTCGTGNCSFPTIPTMGVCGGCVDVTTLLTRTEIQFDVYPAGTYPVYTLPDGNSLSPKRESPINGVFTVQMSNGLAFSDVLTQDTVNISHFDVIGWSYDSFVRTNDPIHAHECALWWCVKAYNVTIESGHEYNTLIDTWAKVSQANGDQSWFDPATNDSRLLYSFYNFTDLPSHFNQDPSENISFSWQSAEDLRDMFSSDLVGNIYYDDVAGFGTTGITNTTDFIEGIWQQADQLDSWIANLSSILTANLILNYGVAVPNTRYAGQALNTVVFNKVRWAWIAFPTALVLMMVLFLIASMVQTCRRDVRAWKSDSLALLLTGIDDEVRQRAGGCMDKPDGLVGGLKGVDVNLVREGENWAFRS